ncbi:MAG: fumarylacetoacetate hydrolase family protein [Defluviitaleaceae bacterium]|nr:fumarylacetoacetate hydrolase family protein [Defluviitaleaceae bacterium]
MKFATFVHEGTERAGVCIKGSYFLLRDLLGEEMSLLDFIRAHENAPLPEFNETISHKKIAPVETDSILAPIPLPPRNVICLGKNYEDHAKEVKETIQATQNEALIPTSPIFFTKSACPAPGDGATIPLHAHFTQKVDYEAELAIIIGKTTYRATRKDAKSAIFGYTILNDITARDIQTRHAQWFFGKSLDGFCPMGPHIVTRDEIGFPPALKISCRVNGEPRQSSCTSNLIFDIPEIIATLSQGITLLPGDIIATGTPAGIGHAMKPPQYLQNGDKVECEIEKIGILTNHFAV